MFLNKIFPKWVFQDFFLDWKLENWRKIYRNQGDLLEIYCFGYSKVVPQVVVFDNTEHGLSLAQIKLIIEPVKFQPNIHPESERIFFLYKLHAFLNRRKLFNSRCIRLSSIELQTDSLSRKNLFIKTQEVDYFDYIKTNLILDAKLHLESSSLRNKIHIEQSNGQLENLSESKLANIFGVNILILTIDGELILQKRSGNTLIRPNEICSSASGSLSNLRGIKNNPDHIIDFREFPFFFREAFEEIGLKSSNIVESKTFFLGITRELIRGGQPELFLSSQVDLDKDQILNLSKKAKDKFEASYLFFIDMGSLSTELLDSDVKKLAFCSRVIEFIQEYDELISIPLLTNLILWCRMRLHTQ